MCTRYFIFFKYFQNNYSYGLSVDVTDNRGQLPAVEVLESGDEHFMEQVGIADHQQRAAAMPEPIDPTVLLGPLAQL
jgi:hypothetical protein